MTPTQVLKAKLAATLIARGEIPYDHARQMTDAQVISLYQFDHDPIRKCDDGPYVGWNLTPRLIAEHRRKTATIDLPAIAKGKRLRRKWAQHKQRMEAK